MNNIREQNPCPQALSGNRSLKNVGVTPARMFSVGSSSLTVRLPFPDRDARRRATKVSRLSHKSLNSDKNPMSYLGSKTPSSVEQTHIAWRNVSVLNASSKES